MDINKEILKSTDKIIEEKLPAMIEESVTKMMKSIVEDVFSNYSSISKEIKKKIEEKLDVNLQEFDLLDYNSLVGKLISDNLVQQVNLQPILDIAKNAIGFVDKKNIKLSEIVEMFKYEAMQDSDEDSGEISLHIKVNEQHDWVDVSIDIEEDKESRDCSICFTYSQKRGNIFIFKTKDHWRKQDNITTSRLTALSILEHKIFRLYSAQVKIETDDLNFETEWYKEY